jgi:hypothetical protein
VGGLAGEHQKRPWRKIWRPKILMSFTKELCRLIVERTGVRNSCIGIGEGGDLEGEIWFACDL